MQSALRLRVAVAVLCAATSAAPAAEAPPPATAEAAATPLAIDGIHNAFRVTERIYSGSQPEGDAAFAALAALGVKTVVSVDGSKPDVERAHKHGLRYVHLPFGYDGVPAKRVAELARLAAEPAGPFFVHCHHGKHRGPTAAALMCEAGAGWSASRAEAWMRTAGTADDYPGLYRAAREFKPPTGAELAAVKALPEVAGTSTLVDAMVAIDAHADWLKQSQAAGWKTPPGHADISPAHEATILWEQFREVPRTIDIASRPEDFRVRLGDAERAAERLRTLLAGPSDLAAIDTAFKQVTQACAACHKTYRNQ